MAHVIAHCDFFRNNIYLAGVPSDITWLASLHARRLRRYEYEKGAAQVEDLLDLVLPFQDFVGPEERDLLLLVQEKSPILKPWQRDVVGMVRTEALYFKPLLATRVINEGWATFWHKWFTRQLELPDGQYTEFARLQGWVETPSPFAVNPYRLGCAVLQDIYTRANCRAGLASVGLEQDSPGRRAILQVREQENDVSFIRNNLNEKVVRSLDLYVYGFERRKWVITSRSFETVRNALILERLNGGVPVIVIGDDNYRGRGELYLVHLYDGRELQRHHAERTLERLWRLWGRRVHLETVIQGQDCTLVHPERTGG